ncbi:MAG TPA: ATP-binding protein [Oligoflexus sp.]|uniref:AAA family ATPase n=1 Tax=Oligoflexus sp. TaxID=1971216 RepID=UPI002D7F4466|nr:ATP-binding protein [Oligoflexus sp.]HET9239132.1 ATP-binding protein [Oligoflexus sp.]
MPSLHIICGPVASGKTTYARQLAQEKLAVLLSLDEAMLKLYGVIDGREAFLAKQDLCRRYLLDLAADSLRNKVPVVLDWGFWKHQDRLALVARFAQYGCPIEMIYLKTEAELRWQRLTMRNQNPGDDNHIIERRDFEFFNSLFEVPRAADYPGVNFHLVETVDGP